MNRYGTISEVAFTYIDIQMMQLTDIWTFQTECSTGTLWKPIDWIRSIRWTERNTCPVLFCSVHVEKDLAKQRTWCNLRRCFWTYLSPCAGIISCTSSYNDSIRHQRRWIFSGSIHGDRSTFRIVVRNQLPSLNATWLANGNRIYSGFTLDSSRGFVRSCSWPLIEHR